MTENLQAQIHAEVCRQLGAAMIDATQLRATVNELQMENNELKKRAVDLQKKIEAVEPQEQVEVGDDEAVDGDESVTGGHARQR